MPKLLYRIFLISMLSIISDSYSNITQSIRDLAYDARLQISYYSPYVMIGSLGCASLASKYRGLGLTFTSCAALYSFVRGYKFLNELERKYTVPHSNNYWSNKPHENCTFLLSRWRQHTDQYGDGFFWPTAWWMQQSIKDVQRLLITDIMAGRLPCFDQGTVIKFPNPEQVIHKIIEEISDLQKDKELLKFYTNIYREFQDPESFIPDQSPLRIFWPHYNRASRLYVDIVIMLKRLEQLREIVARLKVQAGGNKWPAIRKL